jgi:hypothetical protein
MLYGRKYFASFKVLYYICLLELRKTAKASAKIFGFITGIKQRTFLREVSNVTA